MHPLDHFIKRELGCRGYLRFVDYFCLFSQHKRELWAWKQAVQERLVELWLRIHEESAQVLLTRCGIRRLGERFKAWHSGYISFGEFDASIQGWINHVRYADSWGLRTHVLKRFKW